MGVVLQQMKAIGIVTLDYEDYGRAIDKIDPIKNVIDPTYRIADFFESFQIPLTLFVNVTEVMAYERYDLPAAHAYTSQLRDLHNRGHDIQLHFHPQWLDYHWTAKGWMNKSSIAYKTQPLKYTTWQDTLAACRAWIAKVVGSVPVAYRAGGYCIEPIQENMTVLKHLGIKCDSSLHSTKGLPYNISGVLQLPIYGSTKARWDMSGRASDAEYLKEPKVNKTYVMMGHNKQQVHYEALIASISVLRDKMQWHTMKSALDTLRSCAFSEIYD